jgi:hypothetical protein
MYKRSVKSFYAILRATAGRQAGWKKQMCLKLSSENSFAVCKQEIKPGADKKKIKSECGYLPVGEMSSPSEWRHSANYRKKANAMIFKSYSTNQSSIYLQGNPPTGGADIICIIVDKKDSSC